MAAISRSWRNTGYYRRLNNLPGKELAPEGSAQTVSVGVAERDRLVAAASRLESIKGERDDLAKQVKTLAQAYAESQANLQAVFASRAWRWAERCRGPVRKLRSDWPRLYKTVTFVARTLTGRKRAAAANADAAGQPTESVGGEDGRAAPPILEDRTYERWIREREPSGEELAAQRLMAESLGGPVFSVVVSGQPTEPAALEACINSVVGQTYPRWEVCVDARNGNSFRAIAGHDKRVRLTEAATGEFVVLLDTGDTLAPFALFEMAARLRAEPEVDLLYTDHDYKSAETGVRSEPFFKPDWSPAMLSSENYLAHVTVLRRTLFDEIGGFQGAGDWELRLRASEAAKRISHVAKVLCHVRLTDKNPVAPLAALGGHLERCGMDAEPERVSNGLVHLRFRKPPTALVSIIVITKDNRESLARCVASLITVTAYKHFEILIVDNGSQDAATKEYLVSLQEEESGVRVLWHPGPFRQTTIHNRAAREANGDFLLFLTDEAEITRPEWLTEMVCWANLPTVGVVGAKLLLSDGSIEHAGVVLGMNGLSDHAFAGWPALSAGSAGSTGWYREVSAVCRDCLLMRRQVFEAMGGFDEDFSSYGGDIEICLRAWERGYRVIFNPFAELIQHGRDKSSADQGDFFEGMKHWRLWLVTGDLFWNPNLSRASRVPEFRYADEEASVAAAEKQLARLQQVVHIPADEDVWVRWFNCSAEEFRRLRRHNAKLQGFRAVKRVLWFISPFDVPFYGGIYTILKFCDSWRREKQVDIFFAVCGGSDRLTMAAKIRQVYAEVEDDQVFVLENPQQADDLPEMDVSICTLWTTPYFALHHLNVGRRFYLIQDFEPAFYRAGSVSALVDSTYQMGLYGIANTVALRQLYEIEYGGKATHFTPRINAAVFYPAEGSLAQRNPRAPLEVFFYGRPKHPRNAFELVTEAMRRLKTRLGAGVRIVSAGDEWSPHEYGLQGIVENLGLLSYEDSGRLYRECALGVVMMLTRHPSYLPLELMASGCLAVTNVNYWTSWLLKDGENCLLSQATAEALADTVERGLLDTTLRARIRDRALAMVREEYLDWPSEAERVFGYLCNPEAN